MDKQSFNQGLMYAAHYLEDSSSGYEHEVQAVLKEFAHRLEAKAKETHGPGDSEANREDPTSGREGL